MCLEVQGPQHSMSRSNTSVNAGLRKAAASFGSWASFKRATFWDPGLALSP